MKYVRTELVCPQCGNITTIQRKINRTKKVGHIKDLYCFVCREVTKQFEINDVSKFLLTYNEQNHEEKTIRKLILEKRKK